MKICLTQNILFQLYLLAHASNPYEFSGFGWATIKDDALNVYDFELVHVGSTGLTDIKAEKVLALGEREDRDNMKVWIHRHPLGNGMPGPHNWSTIDTDTIRKTPLGGVPELIGWSASVVMTPEGLVGRIDNHIANTVKHVTVLPNMKGSYDLVEKLEAEYRAELPRAIYTNKAWWDWSGDDWGDQAAGIAMRKIDDPKAKPWEYKAKKRASKIHTWFNVPGK